MTARPRSLLARPLPGLGRPLTEAEGGLTDKYLNLLTKWQKTHRFVGSVERAWLIENVLLDSWCFLEALPHTAHAVADLGSGAGIPGIPIAIVRPDLELSLIEARERRVSFLSTAVRELGLAHVSVISGRAETLGPEYAGRYDAVVMRCAGKAETVLSPALRLVRVGGAVVVSSGPSIPAEVRGPSEMARGNASPIHGEPPPAGEELVVRTPSDTLRTFRRITKT